MAENESVYVAKMDNGKYYPILVQTYNLDTLNIAEPFPASGQGELMVMNEKNLGQHLSRWGYEGMGDYIFNSIVRQ
ncbi:MAG: hypothetical protein MJK14_03550, partial [Rivularia sp. ALOHA_DT_140]|nr:hypothetical protein [Rivularia sp. ALOHA_DT_140]